jgi:negative regulator of sigma E activity
MTDDDLDRLADYAAGLMEPDQAARIARLIETEPEWARAHAALTVTASEVTSALAGLAVLSIPTDVADRLNAAIAAEAGTVSGSTVSGSTVSGGADADALPAGTNVIELATRRRWRRVAAGTAAAAAVVAVFVGGISALSNVMPQSRSANSAGHGTTAGQGTAGKADRANSPSLYEGVAPTQQSSGTNYTPQTLRSLLTASGPAAMNAGRTGEGGPPELNRLTDPTALSACLGAIVARHGGQPTVVDYARYQGQPALIVTLSGSQIVVSGPDCGRPGAGPAEIYSIMK